MRTGGLRNLAHVGACAVLFVAALAGRAWGAASACTAVTLRGDVKAGETWQASIGQGWVFRVQPIAPGQAGYSGWDLVVDRDPPAGYPDALLLATLPYNSINEREIGTTYGLRAQDALGWNPRSFRFFIDPAAFREAREIFASLGKSGAMTSGARRDDAASQAMKQAMNRLQELTKGTASGTFRIEDARLIAGVGDPKPYAQEWALAASRIPHQAEAGQASERGALRWMRFTVTLALPTGWKLPAGVRGRVAACD